MELNHGFAGKRMKSEGVDIMMRCCCLEEESYI